MNASQKDYRALSSSLPLGDSLFSLSYSVRFVKNFFLLFSKAFRRFSTRFELFRPPPLAKQLIYITRLPSHCQELFSPFFSFLFQPLRSASCAAVAACGFTLLAQGFRRCAACAVCPLHLLFCQARSWFPPSFPIPVFALFCFACYNDPNPSIIYHREE